MARSVFGLPLYGNEEYLPEALGSLLAQTDPDYAVVVCDDSPDDAAGAVVRAHAADDDRIHYERNPERLGMTANWRRTFELARRLHPDARYFAWASDHDAWHPRFLDALVPELEQDARTVLAYPLSVRIDAEGVPLLTSWRFDTAEIDDVGTRIDVAAREMTAGDMVYGLFRADALERAGIFRSVLLPDRLLLSQLAIHGTFRQVPEILWYRRFAGIASLKRQRASFYPDGTPVVGYLPWWLVHPVVIGWDLVVLGKGEPQLSRARAIPLALAIVRIDARFELLRKIRRTHGKLRKRVATPRRIAGHAVAVAAKRGVPGARSVQQVHHGSQQMRQKLAKARR